MGHDQTFKDLLSPFFLDFLQLFLPHIAEGIDPTTIMPLPTEVFTDIPEGGAAHRGYIDSGRRL